MILHPLYHHCRRLINKPLTVHLADGKSYYGVIHNVTPAGIYFLPMTGTYASAATGNVPVCTADNKERQTADAEDVFFAAPFFFPFGLLIGFTLGLAAGSLLPRPYYW